MTFALPLNVTVFPITSPVTIDEPLRVTSRFAARRIPVMLEDEARKLPAEEEVAG